MIRQKGTVRKMFSILLVSHGALAHAMEESAQMVQGPCGAVHTMEITPDMSVESIEQDLRDTLRELGTAGDTVVLSDLPLGTPFNVLFRLMREAEFLHITGANLPLFLELRALCKSGAPLAAVRRTLITEAREKMFSVNDFCESLRQAEQGNKGEERADV